jgi:hypothetical protein
MELGTYLPKAIRLAKQNTFGGGDTLAGKLAVRSREKIQALCSFNMTSNTCDGYQTVHCNSYKICAYLGSRPAGATPILWHYSNRRKAQQATQNVGKRSQNLVVVNNAGRRRKCASECNNKINPLKTKRICFI